MSGKKQIRLVITEEDYKLLEAVLWARKQSKGNRQAKTPEEYLKEIIEETIAPCKKDYVPSRGIKKDGDAELALQQQKDKILLILKQFLQRNPEKLPTVINIKSAANMSLQTAVAALCRMDLYELLPKDDNDHNEYSMEAFRAHPEVIANIEV